MATFLSKACAVRYSERKLMSPSAENQELRSLPVCLSVCLCLSLSLCLCLSVYLSLCLSVCVSYLPACLSLFLPACLSLSVCLSLSLSLPFSLSLCLCLKPLCLSVCVSAYLPVCLCLSVCLSLSLLELGQNKALRTLPTANSPTSLPVVLLAFSVYSTSFIPSPFPIQSAV